jgi:small-conductance mechanosensitive channel
MSPHRALPRCRPAAWLVLLGLLLAPIASASAAELPPSLHLQVIGISNAVRDNLDRSLAAIALAPAEALALQADADKAWRSGAILRATIYSLVLLMIGGGAEWLYWCYAGKAWRAIAEAAAVGRHPLAPARAAILGLRRAALSGFGAVLFVAGVLVPSSIFSWPGGVQAGVVGAALAITAIRAVRIAAAFMLSPHPARLRLVALPDQSARRLNVTLLALSVVLAGGYGAQTLLQTTLAAPGLAVLVSGASGILAAALSLIVLRFWLPAPGRKLSSGAVLRPIALIGGVFLGLALHLLGAREIVWTALLWVGAMIVGAMAQTLVEAFTASTTETPRRAAEYRSVLKSAVRIAVFGIATAVTAVIWNIPLLQLSRSDTLIGRSLARGFDVIVVVLIADLIWVWARTIIDGKLAAIPARTRENGGLAPSARLATLLPLLRKVILVMLIGLVGLISLSAFGVDIAPLLAGAGVVGIAIGLGAQTLVRDIVSGVFYLLADSFRVGEYVEFGEIRGTVEGISLRFLRIRHHRGAVYTVPFGEIKWLVNLSRDWAVMKLEFRVPFDTDLGLVKDIVGKVGVALMADEQFGHHIIEPLESRGVVRMEEFSMVLGVKCMTKPDDGRFVIRREAYHRIRDAFDEHGIRFAQRHTKADPSGEANEAAKIAAGLLPDSTGPDVHQAAFEHELAFDPQSGHHDHTP